jgi:hypothetical protein
MAQSIVLAGPNIQVFINNKLYKTVRNISFSVDYGEVEIYGIDSPYAQEIAPTKITVRGSVNGLRLKRDGGLQGSNMRPLFTDFAASPYISLRITDRVSGEDIIFIQAAKVTREQHTIATKSIYQLSFDFVGQVPLFALDRA